MSTKIYQAWRVKPAEYPQFARELADYAAVKAGEYIRAVIGNRKKDLPNIVAVLLRSSLRLEWEFGAIDCRLKVVPHGRFLYCVPFSDVNLHGLTPTVGVDYCYWNNTDKPDEVSRKEWTARKRVWDEVLTGWHTAPVFDVIRADKVDHVRHLLAVTFPTWKEWDIWSAYREAKRNLERAAERHAKKTAV